jgi:hypothetical protein
LERFFCKSCANASSDSPSTPATPWFAFTCFYASLTTRLEMSYGFAFVTNSSHSWLVHAISWTIHPLRSRPITDPSALLRVDPPLCLASVLRPLWVLHLGGSLRIEATGSQVTHLSLKRTHATFTPDAALAVSGYLQS